MKRVFIGFTVLVLCAVSAQAQIYTNITNYMTSFQFIAGTNEDVGSTGIESNIAYVCFSIPDMDNTIITTNDVGESDGRWHVLMRGLFKYFYDSFAAVATTNQSEKATVDYDHHYVQSLTNYLERYTGNLYLDVTRTTPNE